MAENVLFVCEGPLTTHVLAAMEACTAENRGKKTQIESDWVWFLLSQYPEWQKKTWWILVSKRTQCTRT
jgi:hypothetical protein